MGKGDMKSRKGKITAGSFGNTRKRKVKSTVAAPKVKVVKEAKAPAAKKPASKKTAKAE
jgi:ribosomal small subunit protein bTHX